MSFKLFTRKPKSSNGSGSRSNGSATSASFSEEFLPATVVALDEHPLKQMLQQGRHAVVLRERETWRSDPEGSECLKKAEDVLEQRMALVPTGTVSIVPTLSPHSGADEIESDVAPYLLDVHCVTNARFQHFVDAGGYDALDFWPEEIWPHLIELKDLTGQPGPRFWRHGRHNAHLADHPVVGISWYEAQAFALWIGQRLPTEMEWQMASSWHIKSSTDVLRRFPWGDAMDNSRCNIWSSRIRRTVPVDSYPQGAAPNHVLQLVGNVWEWTDSEYNIVDDQGRPIVGEMPMHVVRGGAFDTYFEAQATSDFRTGQIALARSYNTGFRCAMNLADATWLNEA
jgi:formylglycine-generating enzyme required for sulfatase activity